MSKSKRNGVDPQQLIAKFGADTARLFVMFAGPPEDTALWSDAGVEGAHRFLRRLWTHAHANARRPSRRRELRPTGRTPSAPVQGCAEGDPRSRCKQANYDYERIQYNTVVSAGMKMLNALEAVPADAAGAAALAREGLSILLRVLYPVVPHITWVLWNELGFAGRERRPPRRAVAGGRSGERWCRTRSSSCCRSTASSAGKSGCPPRPTRKAIEAIARASAEVAKHAAGASPKKVIIVPGRLVNVVV